MTAPFTHIKKEYMSWGRIKKMKVVQNEICFTK